MKYKIGDVIRIRQSYSDLSNYFRNRIGIIISYQQSPSKEDGYYIIVAGKPGTHYWFFESEITDIE